MPKSVNSDARQAELGLCARNCVRAATSSLLVRLKNARRAWANARFSSIVLGPIGTSGSANTRARKISWSVGGSENVGCAGGGWTCGAVRFAVTFCGVNTNAGTLAAATGAGAGVSNCSAALSTWLLQGTSSSVAISTQETSRSGHGGRRSRRSRTRRTNWNWKLIPYAEFRNLRLIMKADPGPDPFTALRTTDHIPTHC